LFCFGSHNEQWSLHRSIRSVHFSLSILNRTRAAVEWERATRSEAPLSTSKNRLALAHPTAASTRGKRRGEAGIRFASLAAQSLLPRRPRIHGFMSECPSNISELLYYVKFFVLYLNCQLFVAKYGKCLPWWEQWHCPEMKLTAFKMLPTCMDHSYVWKRGGKRTLEPPSSSTRPCWSLEFMSDVSNCVVTRWHWQQVLNNETFERI
jgi:hypothetical protein